MLKYTTAICLALLTPTASSAGILGVTADGTWDCTDGSGAYVGAVALADVTYAYIKPDGLFGGYGKLMRVVEDLDLPAFVILDGYLKDGLGASALSLLGPRENTLDYTGDLFLYIGVTTANEFQCVRRQRPGA